MSDSTAPAAAAPAPDASTPDAPAADAPAADAEVQQPAAPAPKLPPPHLMDEEGELSDAFYSVLRTVFRKYAKGAGGEGLSEKDRIALGYGDEAVMDRAALDKFTLATNGQELSQDSYQEIVDYLDTTDKQELTFKGFTQLYSLQTQNDGDETIHDLEAWGYDPQTLKPVEGSAKKAEAKADEPEKKADQEEKKEGAK
ncbi:hypothetical protein JCM8097_003617 [Rhodosporidiobolus ruineniae]